MPDNLDDVEFLKQHLSGDPSEELLEQIASTVVDRMADSFPELSLKSRSMDEVLEDFGGNKLEEVDSTGQYERKLNYLRTYLEDETCVETSDDLTSEDVERYKKWGKYESLSRDEPLARTTLRDDMYLFREFIQYMIEHRMAPARFEKRIEIPEIDYESGEGVDKKKLDPEIAKAALEYLRKYEYAGVEHVSMKLMWQSGPRKGGLIGRDVPDFDYEERILQYETQETTPLKNDEGSEREISLYGETPEIIRDYLKNQRPAETDDEGREPLLSKGDGRISASMLQKIAYMWTRPCSSVTDGRFSAIQSSSTSQS